MRRSWVGLLVALLTGAAVAGGLPAGAAAPAAPAGLVDPLPYLPVVNPSPSPQAEAEAVAHADAGRQAARADDGRPRGPLGPDRRDHRLPGQRARHQGRRRRRPARA